MAMEARIASSSTKSRVLLNAVAAFDEPPDSVEDVVPHLHLDSSSENVFLNKAPSFVEARKIEIHPGGKSLSEKVLHKASSELHQGPGEKSETISFDSCRPDGQWPHINGADGKGQFDLVITWWTNKPQSGTSMAESKSSRIDLTESHTNSSSDRTKAQIENQNEIMYELRSFEKFGLLNHVRNLFLIVDQETLDKYGAPRSLDQSNPAVHIVTDKDLGLDNTNCGRCGAWDKGMRMHTIPGLSDYFLYAPDDVFMMNNFAVDGNFWDAQRKTPILHSYGTWKDGWCDGGGAFGSGHGPILVSKCAMRQVAAKYHDRFFASGPSRDRTPTDPLCLYSYWMKNEWAYQGYAETSRDRTSMGPFFTECHTNGGCGLDSNVVTSNSLFVNVQGNGISDEYPTQRAIHDTALAFFHKTFPVPSRFERRSSLSGFGSVPHPAYFLQASSASVTARFHLHAIST